MFDLFGYSGPKISEKKRYDNRIYAERWRKKNPEGSRKASREWRLRNLAAAKKGRKATHLKQLYGLSLADYQRMIEQQGRSCAICLSLFTDRPKAIHVDHCHKTGRVRALLCSNCNNALKHARDNPEILRRAAQYIEKFGA